MARIARAYTWFIGKPAAAGPVAPAFVAANPNEWVVFVQTVGPAGDEFVGFPNDWSIQVMRTGDNVNVAGSMPEIAAPFIQPA